ncbi:CD63 antigen-like [Melanotaenia boesemani]|uniref:CD63 antigen-like n=1 Tax=Melanotaenia boesemani TaxID=1250792 RepID=UPI001C050FCC|nr:CD63 antigen-like [Melanotaenia boesemani]
MAGINNRLKRIFISFNVFFASVGLLFIACAVLLETATDDEAGGNMEDRIPAVVGLLAVGIITMTFAILGACGAYQESQACLVAFMLCMVLGKTAILRAAISGVNARPELPGVLEEKFRQLPPLDFKGEKVMQMVNSMQSELHCCGLFSYKDWILSIPDSCNCTDMEEESNCKVVYYNYPFQMKTQSIYSKPCFPIYLQNTLQQADITLGVSFCLAALAGIGIILSSIMIYQIRYSEKPTVSTSAPPKYQKLHNLLH